MRFFMLPMLFLLLLFPSKGLAEKTGPPDRFKVTYSRTGSDSDEIAMVGGVLIYRTSGKPPETIRPTSEQWRSFYQAMDDLKVWRWNGNYEQRIPTGISCGTIPVWSFDIGSRHGSVTSKGSNKFPDYPTAKARKAASLSFFQAYCAAINKLLGRDDFGPEGRDFSPLDDR